MYTAKGNQVFVRGADGTPELFLTVHPTHSNVPLEKQAQLLAEFLNDNFGDEAGI